MSKKTPQYDDLNFKLKNGKKFEPTVSVEQQFDKEALKRLHNAIHFTRVMFPNNAIDKAER